MSIPFAIEGYDLALLVPTIEDRQPIFDALIENGLDHTKVAAFGWTSTSVEILQVDESGRYAKGDDDEPVTTTHTFTSAGARRWQRGLREAGIIT